jgi:hypothetical protein
MTNAARPSTDFPIGWECTVLDAWMRDPTEVRITRHPNETHILGEDARGIVHYAHTGRIVGDARPRTGKRHATVELDLLGDPIPVKEPTIEELLG